VLTLLACLLSGGLRICNSDDADTDAFIESESNRLADQVVNPFLRRTDYLGLSC
jgi:hypothetical protein